MTPGAGRRSLALGSLLLPAALGLAACQPAAPPRNLVFISLDTIRADHLTPYGYGRPTSPVLERLAGESVVFTNAFAQQTNTNPSHSSMFTGLYPHVHGNETNLQTLPEGRITLAQILARQGFATGGFVSGVAMQKFTGLDRGFEVYRDEMEGWRRDGRTAAAEAVAWLRALPPQQRFFLFLHLYDAHGPYEVPPERRVLFRSAEPGPLLENVPGYQRLEVEGEALRHLSSFVDLYDTQIRHADTLVGELLAHVDRATTAVVVIADHGETLGERYHVLDHGAQVFDEQIRIPLLLRVPGGAPRRVEALVETVDLLPTLLDLLGITRPAEVSLQGYSLVPLLAGSRRPLRSVVFSGARAESSWYEAYDLDKKRRIHTVRSSRWKLIVYPGVERDYFELYDLERDPGETRNVAAERPEVRAALAAALARWQETRGPFRPEEDLPDDLRRKLKQLGYVSD